MHLEPLQGVLRIYQHQREFKEMLNKRIIQFAGAALVLAVATSSAFAQKKYDVGATDTEIKLGNIMPYSGPVSAYAVIGKAEEAYFRKINDEGGRLHLSAMMTDIVRQKRSSRPVSSLKATKCWRSSVRWERHPIRPFKNILT